MLACFNFNQLEIFASIFNWIELCVRARGLKTFNIDYVCQAHFYLLYVPCKQANKQKRKEKKQKMRFKHSPIWEIFYNGFQYMIFWLAAEDKYNFSEQFQFMEIYLKKRDFFLRFEI